MVLYRQTSITRILKNMKIFNLWQTIEISIKYKISFVSFNNNKLNDFIKKIVVSFKLSLIYNYKLYIITYNIDKRYITHIPYLFVRWKKVWPQETKISFFFVYIGYNVSSIIEWDFGKKKREKLLSKDYWFSFSMRHLNDDFFLWL